MREILVDTRAGFDRVFPGFNGSNLHTKDVHYLVHKTHPVIAILRYNPNLMDIDKQPLIDREWYKIPNVLFDRCCLAIRTKMLRE